MTTTDAFTSNEFMVRGDHRFSDHDSISLEEEWQHSDETNPLSGVGIPGWGVVASTGTQHAVASWTHIFTPSLLAEFRSGYSRQKILNLQQDYNDPVLSTLGIQGSDPNLQHSLQQRRTLDRAQRLQQNRRRHQQSPGQRGE